MRGMFRFAAIGVACVVSWPTTSALLAQQRGQSIPKQEPAKAAVAAPVRVGDSMVEVPTRPDRAGDEAARLAQPAEPVIALSSLKDYKVSVVDGNAVISMTAKLTDRRKGFSFLWGLRVLDADKVPVTELWYDHQIFTMAANGEMEPSFREVVKLPHGSSYVQVSLYEFPTGADYGFVKNEATNFGSGVVRGVKRVNN